MDFETALKIVLLFGTASFALVMTGVGVKALFFRRRTGQLTEAVDPEQFAGVYDRLVATEARVAELEERLDFAERMLTEVRSKGLPQLPGRL